MPVITTLQRQKRNTRRVSVFIDDEFAFGVSDETVLRFGLRTGMEVDDDLRAAIDGVEQRVQAGLTAQRMLSRCMRTENEMRQRLKNKGFSQEVIEESIETLRRARLLDDEAYAAAYVRDRLLLKPRSASRLRFELRAKGVSENAIDSALSSEEIDDEANAQVLAERWLDKHPDTDILVQQRRLSGFLRRRGYSPSTVHAILERMNI